MNLVRPYTIKFISTLVIILSFFELKASDFLYEIGKAHHLIKMNYPIKNFKQFPWDEQLCDLIIESNYGEVSKEDLIKFLNQKYSYLNGAVVFKDSPEDVLQSEENTHRYSYKHVGIGFESYLPMGRKSPYFSEVIKVEPLKLNVKPAQTYLLTNGVYLHIRLPGKNERATYKTLTKISEKELNLDRREMRTASLLKCYFTYSTIRPENELQINKTLLAELLVKSNALHRDRDFMDLMRLLVASFNDGHGVYFCTKKVAPLVYQYVSQYYPKAAFKKTKDQIVVSALDTSLLQSLSLGDTVISVNKLNVLDYLESQKSFYSGATDAHKTSKAIEDFISTWTKDSTFAVMVKRNNELIETKLRCSESRAFTNAVVESKPVIEKIDSKTHFVNLTHKDFNYKNFFKNLDSIKTSERVIFNLIGYPNYEIDKVFRHFIDSSISTPDFESQVTYSNSSYQEWINEPWSIEPHKAKVLGKKLYFLMGENMSWPETLLEMVKTYKLGTTIGLPTYNSNGDISFVKLPAGTFILTGLKVERNGVNPYPVIPDVQIELSEIDSPEKILKVINHMN